MLLAAHQPHYLPYPGFFDKLDRADVFILLDCAQYSKNGWQNRNRLRTKDGWAWLTIPVQAPYQSRICDVKPVPTRQWVSKHQKTLSQLYHRTPYIQRLADLWSMFVDVDMHDLARINTDTTHKLARLLGIGKMMVPESELHYRRPLHTTPDLQLIAMCKWFGCDRYLAGPGGKQYMNMAVWEAHGIQVEWQNFALAPYTQLYPGWVENLSLVDLLLCCADPMGHIVRSREHVEVHAC